MRLKLAYRYELLGIVYRTVRFVINDLQEALVLQQRIILVTRRFEVVSSSSIRGAHDPGLSTSGCQFIVFKGKLLECSTTALQGAKAMALDWAGMLSSAPNWASTLLLASSTLSHSLVHWVCAQS